MRTQRALLRRRLAAAMAATALLVLAGCASTPSVEGEWVDPQFAARNALHGARVLVFCDAGEAVVQQLCQQRLGDELVARGVTPVPAPALARATPAMPVNDDQVLAAAREAGTPVVLSTLVSLAGSEVRPGPGFSVGLGGFGGGHVGGGIGVSVPIGGAGGEVGYAYAANGKLLDVGSGRVMWAAKATTPTGGRDINAQMNDLARVLLAAADKAGLF
jgi:hypothetical protein